MSADFWAGYISGAAGIIIGNPLDLIKVRLQAGHPISPLQPDQLFAEFRGILSLLRGASAPVLGYGGLNALLFVSYNRTLALLGEDPYPNGPFSSSPLWKIWLAGAAGGLATWIVSAPTELVKCRVQMSALESGQSSWSMTREIVAVSGIRGLYFGGLVTSVRDSVGYGFYFWSYELSKKWIMSDEDGNTQAATKVLLCGGIAGVVTWASIFPLDVVKTRVQAQPYPASRPCLPAAEQEALLTATLRVKPRARLGAFQIARRMYQQEGASVFFSGLGVCSLRAFLVNAVQWSVYEGVTRYFMGR